MSSSGSFLYTAVLTKVLPQSVKAYSLRCLERRKEKASIHAFVLFPSLTLERKRRGKERAGALLFLFQTPLVVARRSSPLTESLEHARQTGDQGRFVASVSLGTVAVPLLKTE